MHSHDSLPRRLVAITSVAAGLVLIGASAGGVVALDSELQAASQPVVPTRMVEDKFAPGHGDGRCRESAPVERRSPQV